jgi:hypothetical protein
MKNRSLGLEESDIEVDVPEPPFGNQTQRKRI